MTVVAGLDACRSGWVAIVLDDGRFAGALVQSTFAATVQRLDHATAIGVDIPIGLPADDALPRPADGACRAFVGARRGSVFPTPPRAALLAPSYAAGRRILPSLSAQSYALRRKILEVDAALMDRVFEVHPEASFTALAGAPMAHPKRTWNGLMERRALLAAAGIEIPGDLPGCDAAPDDVLDAAAVAWTAVRKARRGGPDAARRAALERRPGGCDLVLMRPWGRAVSRVSGPPGGGNALGTPFVYQSGTFARDRSDRRSM